MTQTKKIIIIAVIAAVVVLAVVGVVLGIVLSNDYLDKMKGYDYSNGDEYIYNGVEIVSEDGLFYMTRDGEKLSETGYTMLTSVNEGYNDVEKSTAYYVDDFELYDYYIARKPDAANYFLVSSDGTEIAIEGDNLVIDEISLPYIVFFDNVTAKYGAISLKKLSSDLSSNAGSEIALNMYNSVSAYYLDAHTDMQRGYLVAYNGAPGADTPAYTYFGADGSKLFSTAGAECDPFYLTNDEDKISYYFHTDERMIYSLAGDLIAKDVEEVYYSYDMPYFMAICTPEDETLSDEENLKNMYYQAVSLETSLIISNKDYEIVEENGGMSGNLFWLEKRSEDAANTQKTLFNLVTGESIAVDYDIREADASGVVIVQTTAPDAPSQVYSYLDNETGKTLVQSAYADMNWYSEGVLYSGEEFADKNSNIEGAYANYLYFVSPGKTAVVKTLTENEYIVKYDIQDDVICYIIETQTNVENAEYVIDKYKLYCPFAEGGVIETTAYDKIQFVRIFVNGAPVVIATDYDGGKHDFIDTVNGRVIHTVAAAGADMAKISFDHIETVTLVADEYNAESGVELAIVTVTKTDDNGDVANTEYLVFSRNAAMTEYGYVTTPLTVMSLGNNILDYSYSDCYFTVYPTAYSTKLYRITDALVIEELCTVPFLAKIQIYGDSFEEAYVIVNNANGVEGVYTLDGKQILAPVYTEVQVCSSEYIIVESMDAYGLVKYNAKKEKIKQVLDCEYDNIISVEDDGFIVMEKGDWYLYEGNDKVKSDALVASEDRYYYVPMVYINNTVSEETGRLQYSYVFVYNYGGKLYVHRTEAKDYSCYQYVSSYLDGEYIDNDFATVVNFRDTTGAIIESKVVYNTDKAWKEFVALDSGAWYYTAVKEFQNELTQVDFVVPSEPTEPVEPTVPVETDYATMDEYNQAMQEYRDAYDQWWIEYEEFWNNYDQLWDDYQEKVDAYLLSQFGIVNVYKAHAATLFN